MKQTRMPLHTHAPWGARAIANAISYKGTMTSTTSNAHVATITTDINHRKK
jgi:hypothetical protein